MNIEITEKMLEAAHQAIRQGVKDSAEFKKVIRRKYRPVKGYSDWVDVMADIMIITISADMQPFAFVKGNVIDPARFVGLQLADAQIKSRSTYYVDLDLVETLSQCDIPNGVKNLPFQLGQGLLMMPKGLAVSSQDSSLDWILFQCFKKGQLPPSVSIAKRKVVINRPFVDDTILWMCQTEDTNVYSGAIGADFQSHELKPIGNFASEEEFIKQVANLLLQTLLVAEFYPQYSDNEISGEGFSRHKKHEKSKKENMWLNPKWIGNQYTKSKSKNHQGGSHNSPIPHSRRGHWKNQAYGPGWKEHRMILVAPYDVGKED